MNKLKIILNGIVTENPTFVLLLGMCPTLGTTSSAINGMSMGLATMFVLMCSNVVISCVKDFIPDKVRIPSFVVIIAAFVTVLQLCMQAYLPALYQSLGLFIPLIAGKVSQLANIDLTMLVGSYEAELARLETAVRDYFSIESDWSLSSALVGELSTLVDWSQINNVLTSTISFVGSAVIALFSVTFITSSFRK